MPRFALLTKAYIDAYLIGRPEHREARHLYLMDKAKDLLLKPDSTVASVAYELGFEYPQYFARLFKKKVGQTPTQYSSQVH